MKIFLSFLLILAYSTFFQPSNTAGSFRPNDRPIIGIISTPSDWKEYYDPKSYSYMMATYPRYMEKSGARSIYIPYDLPDAQLFKLLDGVNGVLYIGGSADLWETDKSTGKRVFNHFMERMKIITNYVKQKNDNGLYLPLFGICEGYEAAMIVLTNDPYLLDSVKNYKKHGTVQLVHSGATTKMFGGVSDELRDYMMKKGTLFYHHEFGFNLSSFAKYPDIYNSISPTAISIDTNGKTFIAAAEAKDWPLYMTIFHPERVLRESNDNTFKQTKENVDFVMQLGSFFVKESKKNNQKFNSEKDWEDYDLSQYEPITINSKEGEVYEVYVATKEGEIINSEGVSFETDNKSSKTKATGMLWYLLYVAFIGVGVFGYVRYVHYKRERDRINYGYV